MIAIPLHVRDLTGQTFARLTVLGLAEIRDGKAYWHCVCTCGKHKILRGSKLTAKTNPTLSCGCYRADPIVRANARNQLTPDQRSAAAKGQKIRQTPPRPDPIPRVRKPKRDPMPVRADYVPSPAAIAARSPAAPTQPAPKPAHWVAITRDREGHGYRLTLRIERAHAHAELTGRREASPSAARRTADRLYGPLDWLTPAQAGLTGQAWLLEIAPVYLRPPKEAKE